MAEQNNQAERAAPNVKDMLDAFKEWMAKRGPLGAGATPERIFFAGYLAAKRAALTAAVDAEGLPPLPKHLVEIDQSDDGLWGELQDNAWDSDYASELKLGAPLFTAEQYRQGQREAIAPYLADIAQLERAYEIVIEQVREMADAADRRKQAALTQMIELGQEIEAEFDKPARIGSIEDDAQFHTLLGSWMDLRHYYQDDHAPVVIEAWRKFIAYIDGRTAGAANQVAPTDDRFAVGLMSELARRGASPAGLSLAAQLLDVAPCEKCGYRKLHCRCELTTPSHQSPGKEGA